MKKINWANLRWHLIPNIGTIVIVALMLFTYTAWAAPILGISAKSVSDPISYQGTLTDLSDNPISANVDMTFRLYSVSSGGGAHWVEAHTGMNSVPVTNGLFQVLLGSINPIPLAVLENNTLYLGVQIGADPEMMPREILGSVPRAAKADYAISVPDRSISPAKLNLPTGKICLNDRKNISMPGSYQSVVVPELSLPFSLEQPSQVLVWSAGLARYDGPNDKEAYFILTMDSSLVVSAFTKIDGAWFNTNGQRLINLAAGDHVLGAKVASREAGTMILHEQSHFQICLYYIVLTGY